jgi:hypothetical protein
LTRARVVVAAAALSLVCSSATAAEHDASFPQGNEPVLDSEPRVMREPGDVVDVIDAFDDRDPFDIDITLGFGFTSRHAALVSGDKTIGSFAETTAHLLPRIDVGLYKDLAFYATLPIVLSDARAIASLGGTKSITGRGGEALSPLPFRPPNRSGADYLALGLDVGITNQARVTRVPTWMAGAEVRLPLGSSLHACNSSPATGQVKCASPGDADRDGKADAGEPSDTRELAPGVGRGTVGVEVHTYVSRRVHYVEPYAGAHGLFEVPVGTSVLAQAKKAGGGSPPVELGLGAGSLFIPWENRERFGRLSFDVRADLVVRTAGVDHAEVFDALGASTAASLRGASFAGATRVAAFPAGRLGTAAIWQSSRYVKLSMGAALAYAGDHRIALAGSSNSTAPSALVADGGAVLGVVQSLTFDFAARGVVMF